MKVQNLSRHSSAFFRAALTGFCAFLAMFGMLVFAAFGGTVVTKLRTDHTNFPCLAAAKTHELCGGITDGCTFHIQLNAACHHFYIFFLCAGGRAMITDCCAAQTCFYTGLIMVIAFHENSILGE